MADNKAIQEDINSRIEKATAAAEAASKAIETMQAEVKIVEKKVDDNKPVDTKVIEKTFDEKMDSIKKNMEVQSEADFTEVNKKLDTLTDILVKQSEVISDLQKSIPIRKSVVSPGNSRASGGDQVSVLKNYLEHVNSPEFKKQALSGKNNVVDVMRIALEAATGL